MPVHLVPSLAYEQSPHRMSNFCSTFEELWDDGGETERERNKLIGEVYNFVDIPTQTVGDEDEMPLISFGTGPGIENETRWEIKEAIQSGHRYIPAFAAAIQFPVCLTQSQCRKCCSDCLYVLLVLV